jgi:hypothetical protein
VSPRELLPKFDEATSDTSHLCISFRCLEAAHETSTKNYLQPL